MRFSDCKSWNALNYGRQDFSQSATPEQLNRHRILHGRVPDYGTAANSIRAFLLVDTVAGMWHRLGTTSRSGVVDATIPRMANLEQIVRELKSERDRLDAAIRALEGVGASTSRETSKTASPARKGRRTMSAAARRKIAAAQRARWARVKGEKVVPIKAGKSRISAAGRARIAAATRARWAKIRAGKK